MFKSLRCVAAMLSFVLAVAAISASARFADTKKPISKKGLLEAVRLNGFSTKELIGRVRERGVNFQLTEDDAKEFSNAGARPELIQAIRENYRAEARPDANAGKGSSDTTGNGKERFNVPPGPPLSANEIVTMLQSGVPSSRVEQFVNVRGVGFSLTPAITGRIKSAGGSTSLIGAIAESVSNASSNSSIANPPRALSGPDYDQLIEQATAALGGRNYNLAANISTQAIRLDPGKAAAYSLLAFSVLYGSGNIELAEKAARAAIERGGSGVFRVYHDHTGNFSSYCIGSIFVTKTEVTFKADNGGDTFEATKQAIKEAKLNGVVGAQVGAFHLRVALPGTGLRNYNFAPATKSKAEANLILALIASSD